MPPEDMSSSMSVDSMYMPETASPLGFDPALIQLPILLLQIVFFFFYAYFQYKLSKKLDVKYSWMAWVPVLSFFNKLFIAGKTIGWWVKWFVLPIIAIVVVFMIAGWSLLASNESLNGIIGFIPLLLIPLYLVIVIGYIKMIHSISIRTGHGKWWTFGLIFAGWLFWPVTSVHYQKGDEVTPRPFTGVKKFFLIFFGSGVFILAFLGILAAALFPMMAGYKARSQQISPEYLSRVNDTTRISSLFSYGTSLEVYYMDNVSYPATPISECISELDVELVLYTTPKSDPGQLGAGKCPNGFAYKQIDTSMGSGYLIAARVEQKENANFDGSKWNTVTENDLKVLSGGRVISDNPNDWYYVASGPSF